jgi:hypothetical protein
MANSVKDTPAAAKPVAKKSAEPADDVTDHEEESGGQPAWIARLAKEWKNHHHADLELRFSTGTEINNEIGRPREKRQERGAEVVKTVSTAIGIDVSTISYMRRFAEFAPSFEEFQTEHPTIKTWSAVKKLIVEQSSPEDDDDDDDQPKEVRGLITRIQNTRTALRRLKKQSISLTDLDKDDLVRALRKLAKTLEKRAGLQLTVTQAEEVMV